MILNELSNVRSISHFVWNLTSPNGGGALDASFQLFVFLVMGAVFLALDRTVCGQADGVFSAQAVGGDSASTVQRLTTRRGG